MTVIFSYLADRYNKSLIARMGMGSDQQVTVIVNGVEIGEVPDSLLATMQHEVFHSKHTALAQVMNVGNVITAVVRMLIFVVPFSVFWLVVTAAIFSPELYSDMVHEFQKADPTFITANGQAILTLILILVVTVAALGSRFGFKNCYRKAVNKMLRQYFKTAADGDIQVWKESSVEEAKERNHSHNL